MPKTRRLAQGAARGAAIDIQPMAEHGDVIVMPPREGTVIIRARLSFVFPDGQGVKKARALVQKLA